MYPIPEVKVTQEACRLPLADANTCTPVADPDVPSSVTETNTEPELETMASKGLSAVAKSVEAEVTIGVVTGGIVIGGDPEQPEHTRNTTNIKKSIGAARR